MKKTTQLKNLKLNKQTVAHLNQQFMTKIMGGTRHLGSNATLESCTNSIILPTESSHQGDHFTTDNSCNPE